MTDKSESPSSIATTTGSSQVGATGTAPSVKPSGPMTYTVQKGADMIPSLHKGS